MHINQRIDISQLYTFETCMEFQRNEVTEEIIIQYYSADDPTRFCCLNEFLDLWVESEGSREEERRGELSSEDKGSEKVVMRGQMKLGEGRQREL